MNAGYSVPNMGMGDEVFQYTDYRALLRDHYSRHKKTKPGWSYKVWAKALGLRSPGTLVMILNGQRNPGPALTRKVTRYLKLDERQSLFFEDLVRLEKCGGDTQLRTLVMERLRDGHPKGTFRLLDSATFSMISDWWHLAIREMVKLPGFAPDPRWIANRLRFKVQPLKIRQAWNRLVKLGLVQEDADGRWRQASNRVATSNDISDEAIKRYHESILEHAHASLRETPVELREIAGNALMVPKDRLPLAKEMIRSFRREFCRAVESDGVEGEVYQLEVAFFPVTNAERNGTGERK